ncbi:beta-propeller domain-containing protein [Robertkochia sediminum]|uniref:hypothetical protein n=1 Tax=Robertkochia sediminum TaxID=2785326 RepID=UPI0019342DD5|nr:hypothetical protein [Robertkochia sediminum]MBL7473185.1 hypothetical protein [Robertkochia sediminum]
MKNHGFLLLFLLSLGWVYAQQPVNSSVIKGHDPNIASQSRIWNAAADRNPARHADIDGVSFLTVGKDGSYFYVKDFFEGAIGKVFYRASAEAEEVLLFEPDSYACAEEDIYTVSGLYPDIDSRKIAITLTTCDTQLSDLVMVDLEARVIDNYVSDISSECISWLPDGEHILYHRWASEDAKDPKFRLKSKSYIHKVGTVADEDREYFSSRVASGADIRDAEIPRVFYNEALSTVIGVVRTDDDLLKIYRHKGDILQPSHWEPLALEADRVTDFCVGDRFVYYKTDTNAPNYRLMAAQYRWPDISNADEVVAEFESEMIADFGANRSGLYFTTRDSEGAVKLWFKPAKRLTYSPIQLPVRAKQITIETIDPDTTELWLHIWEDNFWELHYRYDDRTDTFVRFSLETTPREEESIN